MKKLKGIGGVDCLGENEVKQLILKLALQNALQYNGTAKAGSVTGRLLAERPDLKARVKEIAQTVNRIVEEVNKTPLSEKKKIVEEKWPSLLRKERAEPEEKRLPPLPKVDEYPLVHVRFAPNPDGSLHIGGSRAAILCDEYAKMYSGRFTLRFDDSDPKTKSPILEAYDWIREDLKWLGVKWHEEVFQSDRLEIYYSIAKQLIEMGVAYVCTCTPADFKKRVQAREVCPCRSLPPSEHLERWSGMLNGFLKEREAVVRIKTDLDHPNPAVREWPALRIIDVEKFPHPRVGDEYRVWPLFAFCCGVDDHDLKISHILRGKEHLTNTTRQLFLYNYLGWKYPEVTHYGRFKMVGTVLSKSKIREGIERGLYEDWYDPRLGTLMALRRRGFVPESIRQTIIEVGPGPVDVTLSWDNINAYNRKLIDSLANRYFFVAEPVKLFVDGVGKTYVSKQNLHPSYPERGFRTLKLTPKNGRASLLISKKDLEAMESGRIIRLMGLFNVEVKEVEGEAVSTFHSESYLKAKKLGARLIHWIPANAGKPVSVIMPDTSTIKGLAEEGCKGLKQGDIVQFERFGFVRVYQVDIELIAYYAHS
jgi:glutamyl-tRNA synthetase